MTNPSFAYDQSMTAPEFGTLDVSPAGRMATLGLYVRQGAPWFADLRAELLSFPAGKHDDQVDALGLVGQLLDKIRAGENPKPPTVVRSDGYVPSYEDTRNWSWKTL